MTDYEMQVYLRTKIAALEAELRAAHELSVWFVRYLVETGQSIPEGWEPGAAHS